MPELNFAIENAEPVPYSATPLIALKLRIDNGDPAEQIHGILLQCQIRIEPARRRYSPPEQAGMLDLFGEPERWSQTLRSTLWTHVKYERSRLHRFDDGRPASPLLVRLQHRGHEVFPRARSGRSAARPAVQRDRVLPAPGTRRAGRADSLGKGGALPAAGAVWKQVVDQHYPNTAWLALRRDIFDRLHEYKMRHSIPTWEQAFEQLLAQVGQEVCS